MYVVRRTTRRTPRRAPSGMASEDELAQRLAAGLASLGKQGFRAGQEEAVRAALDKRDALVVLPTGGGKSLCYMLAAQLQTGARPAWVLASRRADKTNPAHAAQACAWWCRRCGR